MTHAFIPSAQALTEEDMLALLQRADETLHGRPPRLRRQLHLAISGLNLLAWLRFLRPMARVRSDRLGRFLNQLQDSPLRHLRLAVWGLRSLIFAGYYGDIKRQRELGYRPRARGWETWRAEHGHESR